MKTKRVRTYIFPMIAMLLLACSRGDDDIVHEHLSRLDAMLDEQPQAVSDSLKRLNPESLSRGNRAYFGLLKTISGDKTYTEFTSDSLINGVERYYNRHGNGTDAHIRSLVYQGIVRYRMGITDSTMLIPLKEAEQLYLKQKLPNPSTGYMLYYYLGDLLSNNNDFIPADNYFNKALRLAKQKADFAHIFDAYLVIYWNEMVQEHFDRGRLYLDSLQNTLATLSPDSKYRLLNAQSVYYKVEGEIEKVIESNKQQLALLPYLKGKVEVFKIYYSLSEAYSSNNELSNAMYYAKLAIEHIADSTYNLNYLLYENVADIAEKQHDYSTANQYRKNAAEIHEKNIESETDKSLLELEKQYNLTEAENNALRAQRHSRLFITTTIIAVLFILLLYVYFSKQKALVVVRNKQLEAEKKEAQTRALLIQQQAGMQEQMLEVYGSFLQQYALQQQSLRDMATKVRSKNPGLADRYDENLKEQNRQFTVLTTKMFTAEKLRELLNIHSPLDYLNDSERLILFMLACKAENKNIAALLHTTPISLKARKTQLKKKIMDRVQEFPDSAELLSLF